MSSKDDKRKAAQAKREQQKAVRQRQARRAKQVQILAGIVVVAIIVVGVIALVNSSNDKKGSGDNLTGVTETRELLTGVPQKSNTLGNPNAKYTIVEFADLQCPACAKYTVEVLPTIVDKYVRNGQVKLQHELLTFIGSESLLAAQLADAATLQNKGWDFINLFYHNQGAEGTGYVTKDFLRKLADATPGLNVKKALSDQNGQKVTDMISASQNEANKLGINSTPTLFISKSGGKQQKLEFADLEPDTFTKAIDAFIKANK